MNVDVYLQNLNNNSAILKDFLSRIDEDELKNRIRDYWTIREHVEHLVISQSILLERIKIFIENEKPIITPYKPTMAEENGYKNLSISDMIKRFASIRKEQIELIKSVDRKVWKRKAQHPEYKKYDFDILVRHILVHDGLHFWRIEELWIGKEEYLKPLDTI